MSAKEFLAKRRVHLIFFVAVLSVLAFNIVTAFTAGHTVPGASWKAIGDIRPLDYLMLALFWYACAVYQPKDGFKSSIISLNLEPAAKHKN
jgi:hypothetical protein